MKSLIFLLLFFNICSSQYNLENRKHYFYLMEKNHTIKRFDSVVKFGKLYLKNLEDTIQNNSSEKKYLISSIGQINALKMISEAYEQTKKIDSSVFIYDVILKNGKEFIGNDFLYCELHYNKAKLRIKNNDINNACNDLQIATSIKTNDDYYIKSLLLKDSLCSGLIRQKEIAEKKKMNPNYGNQIALFSIIGLSKSDIKNKFGNYSDKNFESIGLDKYECFTYNTKNGVYKIGFKNDYAYIIFMYPSKSIEQKLDKKSLWLGGVFEIENSYFIGCNYTSSTGFNENISFYSLNIDCENVNHNIVFYGSKNGFVNKIVVY